MLWRAILLIGILAFYPLSMAEAEAPSGETSSVLKADIAVFDEVWRIVDRDFYDPHFNGADWQALRDKYRPQAEAAADADAQAGVIDRMLAELHASHTARYRPDDPAYYQLLDIFAASLHRQLRQLFPDGVQYPGIGIFTKKIDGKIFISGIIAGLPAAGSDLKVGDEILAVDGKPFEAVNSFAGKTGKQVKIRIRRHADSPVEEIVLTPVMIKPAQAFLDAMADGARIIEAGGKKIGYIRIWSYASDRYQDMLEEQLAVGKLKDADALVWDLRDGWGGAQPDYLDIFDDLGPTMTLTERDGDSSPVNVKWRKPVALLINEGSRSGKEVLAYGFKKYRVGDVIGSRTAGALLAARAFLLADDSLLLLAVADVAVDGERLEGRGVTPTIEVPFSLPYAGGEDPQLDKAVEILSQGLGG
ncbi:S41 family peptidase [Dongia soli]|uniref:S41 family peptidase n=1 Tax=Dongia soli TaxID=600628 RepID=A0ABU5EER7_9PROT|nr:S41 family peptidase [Dongia soli]MDY0884822.1 S41 family peptidase [Dongia soli]